MKGTRPEVALAHDFAVSRHAYSRLTDSGAAAAGRFRINGNRTLRFRIYSF